MKFTLSWLRDHLDTKASLGEIVEALSDLGLEVEGVQDPGERLGAFTIARVIEARPHPNADRLRLCRVETWPEGPGGFPEEVQVVCGAPNARTGMIGVFAPVGTHVPGTGVDLAPGVIRGEASNGMLCSGRELMISDDHDGIIDLPEDAPLGARFIDYAGLDDPVIDIAITPNRGDALGVRGIARDLAARGLGQLKELPPAHVTPAFACPIGVDIAPEAAGHAPHFMGRMVRGVRNGPSPAWMQNRLRAIGLRPISALVDITNYFTFDLNRPLHVFDAGKVAGNLRLYPATGGERLMGLDDKEHVFPVGATVIADDHGPESIAGVMGGLATGVTDETVDVFIEAAFFDPIATATTGRAMKLNTDARYRFERGIDPAFTAEGLERATAMILDLCGGEASDVVEAGAAPDHARAYRLDVARTARLVGMDIPESQQRQTLTALGFRLEGTLAHVPSWRSDIDGEADLVEEVARIASLSRLEGRPMARAAPGVPVPVLTPLQRRERTARRHIAGLGFNECVTYSFIDAEAALLFGGSDAARLENPISSEMSHLRPDLLAGLLRAAARNQARGFADLALFEVAHVFSGGEPGEQALHASAVQIGATAARDPHGSRRPVDVFDVKGAALDTLAALGAPVERLGVQRGAPGWFHPGRSGLLTLGPKTVLAAFGEVHPKVLRALDVKGPAVAFTLYPATIPAPRNTRATRPALVLADLQPVDRDFAFVVPAETEAEALLRAARGADKALIADVTVFDVFEGPRAEAQMGPGNKSVAISLRLQPTERTMTEAEIEAVGARVIEAVAKATGGTLRG